MLVNPGLRRNIGSTSQINSAMIFQAPLLSSTALARGTGSPTFTRATMSGTGAVTNLGGMCPDYNGVLQPVMLNCAPFEGSRIVTNLLKNSNLFSDAAWSFKTNVNITANVADPLGGTNASTLTATGVVNFGQGVAVANFITPTTQTCSIWMRRRTGTGQITLGNRADVPITLTSAWQRFSQTSSNFSNTSFLVITMPTTGDEIDIFQGQLELGSVASEYIPTTSAPITKCYATLLDGTPIPDSTLKGYLSEPSAVNVFLNSGVAATQDITVTTANSGKWTTTVWGAGTITTSAGTATATGYGAATVGSPNTITVTGNGSVHFTLTGGDATTRVNVENSAFGTSWIPTTSAAVTRAATSLTYNQNQAAPLSMYAEIVPIINTPSALGVIISDGTTSNRIVNFYSPTSCSIQVVSGGTTYANLSSGTATSGVSSKTAQSVATNNVVNSTNGSAVTKDTSVTIPTTTQINIGVASFNTGGGGNIRNVRIYNKALSDAQLQAITK